jgi:hypothetical protein
VVWVVSEVALVVVLVDVALVVVTGWELAVIVEVIEEVVDVVFLDGISIFG